MIEPKNSRLTIKRQCELLDLNRTTYYVENKPYERSDIYEVIDEITSIHFKRPFMGSRRIKFELNKAGFNISRKKVTKLMQELKISAIYPGMDLSKPRKEHMKYPYLLKNLDITRPDQVWSTDITYIKTKKGFMYLTAIIDVYSRCIIEWELSNSLSKELCTKVLTKALEKSTPEIVNTDQGVQYTSNEFTGILKSNGIKISMDSKGRALDNIWIERFWRTVKYEEIYLKDYKNIDELYKGLAEYIEFYNNERGHQSFDYATPASLYRSQEILQAA